VCESRAVLHARAYQQSLPELVKQCICVSFTKVMVGVHVMNYNLSCRLVKTRSSSACGPTLFGTLSQNRS